LEELLLKLDKENKMKSGIENMLEVYFKDKKRTKDLELQLSQCNISIDNTNKRIEHIRTNAGKKQRCLKARNVLTLFA
jgi:predicted  nucleic acid-binding Zn-ribbon protein